MWIKICGIRDAATVEALAEANAVGLNFYAHTPRNVSLKKAADIVEMLPESVLPVGLFVNAPPEEILSVCRRSSLRVVQLHGDETPEFLAELQRLDENLQIIQALHLGSQGMQPVAEYLQACRSLDLRLFACLLDAKSDSAFGGTGQTLNWELVRNEFQRDDWPRLILAGGLHPGNVEEAIATAKPWGVDVASGVESAPGIKNPQLVRQFIRKAKSAFRSLESA